MRNQPNKALHAALYASIKPLTRMLLRCGWSHRDLSQLLKRAFVDVATKEYGERGRPANISRVALLTGLSRKEVSRIRNDSDPDVGQLGQGPATQILNLWHTSPYYVDANGAPLALPYGGMEPSFCSLVGKAAGDIPAGAIKAELTRSGAVMERADGRLQPLKRHFVPVGAEERLVEGLGLGARTLLETVDFNGSKDGQQDARFQRIVYCREIPSSAVEEIRRTLTRRLTQITHEVDDYLVAKAEHNLPMDRQGHIGIGIGLHYFEDQPESKIRKSNKPSSA